jgi:hypothetical protein
MKSKSLNHWVSLSSAGILLMIVLLYLLIPDFGISLNRSLEMIKSGSDKGLMMIYYQFGGIAFLFASLTYAIQLLSVSFDNSAVSMACYGFFSATSAKGILVFGGLLAATIAYGIGNALVIPFEHIRGLSHLRKTMKPLIKKSEYICLGVILATMTLNAGGWYLVLYAAGVIRLDYRKVLAFAAIGLLIGV